MKSKRLILLVVSIFVVVGIFVFQKSSAPLSPDQKELIDLWGYPDQFKIAYLPKGDDELIRSEVWIYSKQQKQVQFLAGNSIAINSFEPISDVQTTLKPENFSFIQTKQDIEKLIGEEILEPIDFLPGISDDSDNQEVLIYLSPQAIFTIEHGHLTYMETIGLEISQDEIKNNPIDETSTEKTIEESQLDVNTLSYHSDFLGFSTSYPQNWFLSDDILTTYDANKPLDEIVLPDKFLKCDFLLYNPDSLSISNPTPINDQITKGIANDLITPDGPGLGDAVIYKINHPVEDLALLCYSFDSSFETNLINLLNSITFDSR
jgi:hypothetical protein